MRSGAAAIALLLPLAAQAQPSDRVEIGGAVQRPTSYSVDALASRPIVSIDISLEGRPATFVGPLLYPMLEEAGLVDGPGKGAHLQHVLIGRGADGYGAALAIGEVDPNFEGKPVIVAYKQDGVLLAHPRLIVPGDKKAGRDVRDLVAIEVH